MNTSVFYTAVPVTSTSSQTAAALSVERVQPSYVQVASQLRTLILGRQLQPGERLPAEAELAALFGVSRTTTREALRLLAAENLVETRRGVNGGSFVVHPEPAEIERALATAVELVAGTEHLSHAEVFEVWQLVQPAAARFAARRRTAEHVERLLALSAVGEATLTDGELTLQAMEFHRVVLNAAGNRLLEILTRPLAILGARPLEGAPGVRAFVCEAIGRHRVIAEAIAAGDEDLAAALMADDMARPADRRS